MAILSFNLNWEVEEVLANKHTTASRTGKRKFDSIQLAFFILKTEVEACVQELRNIGLSKSGTEHRALQ